MSRGAIIIDVRTPAEFIAGHAQKSINIPIQDLQKRMKSLDPEKPIILCCASGSRSAIATRIFTNGGFKEVLNAGPWKNVRGL